MTDAELADHRAVHQRQLDIGQQLHRLMVAWRTQNVSAQDPLFNAEWERLWAEDKAVTLQIAQLEGLPERLAELQWREHRADFTAFGTVDPSVALTALEREELTGLRAAFIAKLNQSNEERKKRISEISELRRPKGEA